MTEQSRTHHDVTSHLPPQNLEAEEAILGAMLMSPSVIETVADLRLKESDFYKAAHQLLFSVILELADRDAVDELTVVNELKRRNQLVEAGGTAAIVSLAQRTPAVANARAYAQEVIDQAVLRGLVETGLEISRLGYEHPEEPPRLLDMAGVLVGDLAQRRDTGDFLDASDLFGPLYDELASRAEEGGQQKGIATGFIDFDNRTGGLQPGNLVIVAGRPGMGKTSWAMNIAEHVALHGDKSVALFSLEMDPQDLMTRMMCSVAKVDQKRVRVGTPHEQDWPLLVDAVGRLTQRGKRMFIADTRELTPMTLRAKCRRLHRQQANTDSPLGLIIIDYMQLMDGGKRFEGRTQEISYISRQLKSLALELGVPVIALSQLSRAVESRPDKRPQLSDLRESGSIEQDADLVLFLFRPEYYTRDETAPEWVGKAQLIIAKHRNGENGDVIMGFLGKYTKFVNLVANDRTNLPRPDVSGGAGPAPGVAKPAPAASGNEPVGAPAAGGFGIPAPPADAGYGDVV